MVARENMVRSRDSRQQIEELRRDCDNLRRRLSSCNSAGRRIVAERDDLVRQLETARAQTVASNKLVDKLLDQITALTKDLTRSPEVLSEAILTGIGTILNGYATQAAATRDEALESVSMNQLGLDNDAGIKSGHFFPDIEFDEHMETRQSWPTPGMMTSSPVTPHPDSTPSHAITNDGQIARMDGQPMFQAGTSGPPPVGGIE